MSAEVINLACNMTDIYRCEQDPKPGERASATIESITLACNGNHPR